MAGYHEHLLRRASDAQRRHLSDEALLVHIKAIHAETRGAYGWPVLFHSDRGSQYASGAFKDVLKD